jgi:hypothetical protein
MRSQSLPEANKVTQRNILYLLRELNGSLKFKTYKYMEKELKTYCEEHWWNMDKKELSFKGELKDLLDRHNTSFTKTKTDTEGIFTFRFNNPYGITFKTNGQIHDFPHLAKQFIQMELVRMGDRSTLYVGGTWRPNVTVNH